MTSSNHLIRVDIFADGNVKPEGSGNGWLSLDDISFVDGK